MLDIAIPSELLEVGKIHILPFVRKGKYPPMAELQYISSQLENQFINCTIITPPLIIDEWNSTKGRLKLNCNSISTSSAIDYNSIFKVKLDATQEYIISSLYAHQDFLLGVKDLTHKEIDESFRRLFDGEYLTCYISPHHLFPLYSKGNRVGLEDFHSYLRSGQKVRLIIQLNGISRIPLEYLNTISRTNDNYSFRIQHQILGAYIID